MSSLPADCLNSVPFPELNRTLGSLSAVKKCELQGDTVKISIELPVPGYPHQEELSQAIEKQIRSVSGDVNQVDIEYSLNIKGPESGAKVGLHVKNMIAVGSGKGGVGKSTVAASLAYGLQSLGAKVGLLDADVYGPSIPHMTGSTGKPEVREHLNPNGSVVQRIHPVEHDGLKLMSIGFLVPEGEAIIWRGPMLHKMLTQFVAETEWGELDYLIVDMPPGTGDVALTLSQMLSLAGAVVVCTPQKVALLDAVKAIGMYQKVNIPILGMVENMTGEIFGRGGAEQAAADQKIPFLGEVPIEAEVRICGDERRMKDLFIEESKSKAALESICARVAMEAAKVYFKKPATTTLEILQ